MAWIVLSIKQTDDEHTDNDLRAGSTPNLTSVDMEDVEDVEQREAISNKGQRVGNETTGRM